MDQRILSAVCQVAVAVGRSQLALLSDGDMKEKKPIKEVPTSKTPKVILVTPPAPELIEMSKW